MQLRWTPARADLDDAMAAFRRAAGGYTAVFPYLGAVAALVLAVGLAVIGLPAVGAGVGVAAVLLAVFGVRLTNRAIWRNPMLRRPAEAAAGPAGLRVSIPTATTDWQWQSFTRAVETGRSFVLIGRATGRRSSLFTYLPKRAAAGPAEVDRLRALLAAVLPGGVRAR